MSFTDLGYAASNELSPDAWKEYMLGNLAKQDAYQQERLNQYVALQERARAKAKREKLVDGIKTGLQYGITKVMEPNVDAPLANQPIPAEDLAFNETNILDQFNSTQFPWENQ